jgi:hypothetical protein
MIFSLTWLPGVLKEAGLKVALVDGWESRGRREMGPVAGVMCHHTVGPRTGNMPSLRTLINGRSDLPGPLAQLGLGRDGTYYVIAAGRCNHAGEGMWKGITTGNMSFIGIEGENAGVPDDRWPHVQMDAYQRGVAAILKHIGRSADFCCGHREYALPKGRKPDPLFDMEAFRSSVAAILSGTSPVPVLIPTAEPSAPAGASMVRQTLRRGHTDELVRKIQAKVGAEVTGHFGADTEAAVRNFQLKRDLVPDGIVGPKTWAEIDRA